MLTAARRLERRLRTGETGVEVPPGRVSRFFGRRGQLALDRDRAAHRRYAWLYEDLLN